MVHADSSNFAPNLTKSQTYTSILDSATALFADTRNWVANTANTSSLLWHGFHSLGGPSNQVNWAGFYVRDPSTTAANQLILGPFHGKVACQTIRFGKGVCGAAAEQKRTQLVPDVEKFPGHIACDGDSKSEIVVPILKGGETVAIIDIDCAVENGFDEEDQEYLEKLATLLADACDW